MKQRMKVWGLPLGHFIMEWKDSTKFKSWLYYLVGHLEQSVTLVIELRRIERNSAKYSAHSKPKINYYYYYYYYYYHHDIKAH